ncbi:hypothetical protein C0991_001922, partial [Blastosporella zonata]
PGRHYPNLFPILDFHPKTLHPKSLYPNSLVPKQPTNLLRHPWPIYTSMQVVVPKSLYSLPKSLHLTRPTTTASFRNPKSTYSFILCAYKMKASLGMTRNEETF